MHPSDLFDRLRPTEVTISCVGQLWRLHLDTAYRWLGHLALDLETLAGVFPGAVGDDDVAAMLRLSVHEPDIERRWVNAARVAVTRGSGRDWWWAVNLSRRCLQGWPYINGRLLMAGVDARSKPFPDWLDAAYMLLWTGQDENGRIKLDLELSLPPVGVAVRQSKQQKVAMLEAFASD